MRQVLGVRQNDPRDRDPRDVQEVPDQDVRGECARRARARGGVMATLMEADDSPRRGSRCTPAYWVHRQIRHSIHFVAYGEPVPVHGCRLGSSLTNSTLSSSAGCHRISGPGIDVVVRPRVYGPAAEDRLSTARTQVASCDTAVPALPVGSGQNRPNHDGHKD